MVYIQGLFGDSSDFYNNKFFIIINNIILIDSKLSFDEQLLSFRW